MNSMNHVYKVLLLEEAKGTISTHLELAIIVLNTYMSNKV